MGIKSVSSIGNAFEGGSYHFQYVTKIATPVPVTAGYYVDMNQTAGQPKYNAFAGTGAAFNPLIGEGNAGVYVGPYETGKTKHLLRWQGLNGNTAANTVSPDYIYLNDYLGFYPLIDCDDLDIQAMDNTLTLPRYESGEGVRLVIIAQAPMINTASVTITYTNSQGVTGRTSTFFILPAANIGVCASSSTNGSTNAVAPFWPLADGDTGMRAIESVQFAAGAGGFVCLALVKPLANQQLLEAAIPVETQFSFDKQIPPEIKQGAYLNFLIKRSGTGAGSYRSEMIFVNI